MHVPFIFLILAFLLLFLYFLNFVIYWPQMYRQYWPQMYRQWVSCDCNFSYNFKPVFSKLCTCFLLGLQKCMWFGYMILNLFLSPFPLLCHFLNLGFYESVQTVGTFWAQPTSCASYEKMHMLLMKFLYWFPLPKMNITFAWEVGRGWGGGRGRATSTSVKFDLFLFYMNSKHIMKLKITRKKTYNGVKN